MGALGAMGPTSGGDLQIAAELSLLVVFLAFAFLWVHIDADLRGYKRSRMLTAGLILLPLLFFPIYVFVSRSPGERSAAQLRLVVFVGLLFFVTFATEFLLNVLT